MPQNTPTVSAEIFLIPLEPGRCIVYAPLRRAAFVANHRLVNFLADLRAGRWDENEDPDGSLTTFLRGLQILDAGAEPPPVTTFTGPPQPTSVTLLLTTACNLRCTYCYAAAGDTPVKTMSLEVAKRGIDFVAANAAHRGEPFFEIAYHGGGEPTVNWPVMTKSFDYARRRARQLDVEVRATSATNGVLNDRQIDWIIANLEGVSLSFDGLPEVHDRNRLTALGMGSSELVMHTMRRFDDAGYPYGLRVTVTAEQIPMMAGSIEFICHNFRPERIQVEPAYQMGRWRQAPSAETEAFIAGFQAAQEAAARLGREIHFSATRLGTLTNHFCGVTQDSFALSPDGNVSACYEVFSEDNAWARTFFYGRPEGAPGAAGGGYIFDPAVLDNLRRQAVEHREWCKGCFAKWTCAGDCYHKSLIVNGSGGFAGTDRCHVTRELTKDQILARIRASGGLFWHEPEPAVAPVATGKETFV